MKNSVVTVKRFVRPSVYGVIIVYTACYSSGNIRRWDLSKKFRHSFGDLVPWYTDSVVMSHCAYLPKTITDFLFTHQVSCFEGRSSDSYHVTVWGADTWGRGFNEIQLSFGF